MPRSSGNETTQRRALRVPSQLRTSGGGSDSDPSQHNRSKPDRSPKLGGSDKRSPRGGALSDPPVNQKKLGTRIDHLESQLGQAQEELKNLRDQLVSAEDAKKAAQEQLLQGKSNKVVALAVENQEKKYEVSEENEEETDVFEVTVEKVAIETPVELSQPTKEGIKPEIILEPPSFDDLAEKDGEIIALKAKLAEKEEEMGAFCKENESLRIQLDEKSSQISSAQSKEEETIARMNQLFNELEESKKNTLLIHQKLEASESAKAALETEMKKMRVQTEQWRKAADAAAAVLSSEVDMNGRRVSERCGSMEKHIGAGNVLKSPLGHGYIDDYIGTPMIDDTEDGFSAGKRKTSGIRMFGDLWKKKGQK